MIFKNEIQKPEKNTVQRTNMYTARVSAQPHYLIFTMAF